MCRNPVFSSAVQYLWMVYLGNGDKFTGFKDNDYTYANTERTPLF